MAKYRLNIEFTEKDLSTIYNADEKVIVVKHTTAGENNQVAWVSFKPFIHNTIDWENDFAVYASTTEIQGGATISKLSDKYAGTKIVYELSKGYFANAIPTDELAENTYAVKNMMKDNDALTFGLAQSVAVNGQAFVNHPINAISVPYGQGAYMTPVEKVDVYLRNDIRSSTVISRIMSIALPVEYSGSEGEHTITYDGAIGKFFPIN
ncbi:MAG: hypothetical protein LBV33_00165 [Lachnospiraceae bacterium]|jgi:hypothetical protein|nr:hypothetical protein [Lachnospiraceae bacterium]